jgi:hypothetical protein
VVRFCLSDVPITRFPDLPIPAPHPAIFQLLLQTKHFRKFDAMVTLASRLRALRATLG